MKKNTLLIVSSLGLTILLYFFWWNTPLLSYLDYKLYDFTDHATPSTHFPSSTVVVEIDDNSLKQLGQWPWPRIITAKLIEKIAEADPLAISLDMVFSENDRTSPATLKTFYHTLLGVDISINGLPQSLEDNDAVLSSIMTKSPMVLPLFSNTARQSGVCILPDTVTYNHLLQKNDLLPLNDLVCNQPRFQNHSRAIGHIHAAADGDGILRRLSLGMTHEDIWIPTLGVATIASVSPKIHFDTASPLVGGINLTMAHHHFYADRHAQALLHFYPFEHYEKISAVDILSGAVSPDRLKGKYIFIGSTALGLDRTYTMSDGSVRSGVYIHATLVENILNNDVSVQPTLYPPLNLIIGFFLSLLLLVQMLRKHYLSVLAIFTLIIVVSAVITYGAWQKHIYISIGYLLIPLGSYLFILALLMFIIDYRNKKRFIDELNLSTKQKQELQMALYESESEIEYQKAMIFQQSKLAAMGEMIDNIAHQWRQPLNLLGAIVQNSEFAFAKGRVDSAYLKKMSADSMEQILFMSQTIEDFRNFVKPDRKNSPFDIAQPLEESLRLVEKMFNANGITIGVEYGNAPLIVMGSPSEFKQVIINLLHNARDALLENRIQTPYIRLQLSSTKTDALITITDNGGGIPAEIIDQIFNPYFSTKHDKGGSGIGLYICDAIIRTKMGGSITASTTEDGTIFTIRLPLKH
ncbi:MAG: CHASE2 and HATPase_c domain-containing protein [Sulfuricurvum sp.]|uniref:CHASE2 and HATPase_c domain-containing protein n=1 Tax=Sulfuricurvum sp. TaxID=2025608 RepID=UPI00261B617A|nr:CHASE2 and HATPase_c domain-containing protein [Sulfuricurvum sp.]MDD2828494.1 CHASE2 and HATPase_c domain-containing protein [Sulfuricurvum sp.]MDD4948975.1 CHASE2 and HATPase_c domain-containing protein [Sulfuricurvum sp.]